MTEREFDLLLDVVRDAVDRPARIISVRGSRIDVPPVAANDNGGPWPLLPFPDGWHASC